MGDAPLPASAGPAGGQPQAELGPVRRGWELGQLDQGEPGPAHVLLAAPGEPGEKRPRGSRLGSRFGVGADRSIIKNL